MHPIYYEYRQTGFMNDVIQYKLSPSNRYCREEKNNNGIYEYPETCGNLYKSHHSLFKDLKLEVDTFCRKNNKRTIASLIGRENVKEHAGNASVHCYTGRYGTTSCYGGEAIYKHSDKLTFQCKKP